MNRRHTSAAFSAAGFLWLFAVLFVIVTGTPVRVLVASLLLAGAAMVVARLRTSLRRFQLASKVWKPATRGNS